MDEQRKNNENHFVGTFNDSCVNDSSIPFNALTYQSSSCNFSFKCEDEQETDQEVKKEINGICNDSVEVGDVRIQSNSNDMSFVFEEMKVTNCYSESECVIEKQNSGNDSEQDPLLLNEEDLYRKIILESNSASYFPSKIKKERPEETSSLDEISLESYNSSTCSIHKRRPVEKCLRRPSENKINMSEIRDVRIVLERIDLHPIVQKINSDVLAASSVNVNGTEDSLAKVTYFPRSKRQSGDVVNILKEKENESAQDVDSVDPFSKDVINPLFSKNECQGKSLEQSIVCRNCQQTKHFLHVPNTSEAQKNNVNKNCECRSNDKGNKKMEVISHTKKMELIKRKSLMQFLCSYCGNTFSSKTKLSEHIMTHSGEKPFHCPYCEYKCSRKAHLNRHISTHTGVKLLKCSYCEYKCITKGNLKNHIFTHTGEKPFKCSYCEYRCYQKGHLKNHILTHTLVKPFKCSYCEYRCSQKGHLKRHILTHTDEKPFKCANCEYRCITKANLKNHILNHTGVKPFKCSFCEYRCSHKGHLKNHIFTHTDEKPFKCANCEYRCITKRDLKNHILTHTGMKPFKCSFCEYRCIRKGDLKKHILTHTGVRPLKCSYCEYTCIEKHFLRKHVKKHSAVKP